MAITATVAAVAVPLTADALDQIRTGMAARYLQARIMDARLQAVRRSAAVALRFEPADGTYRFAEYFDGNANGVRTDDIRAGVDPQLAAPIFLRYHFPGVSFGLGPGVPDLDGARSLAPGDGVRVGTSRILTLGPDGTATSGTLYIRGRRGQWAVRILGGTGRTRLFRYYEGLQRWVQQ